MSRTTSLLILSLLATACSGGSGGSDSSSADQTAPVIGAVAGQPAANSLRVQWSTDEAATAELRFGTTDSYELGSVLRDTLATEHSLTVSDLDPESTYHVQVVSTDAAGNVRTGTDLVFVTLPTNPVVGFSQASQEANDASGVVTIEVELDRELTSDLSLPFQTAGSATEGDDYTAHPNPLVIPAGETSAFISVALIDNATVGGGDPEGMETAVFTLQVPQGFDQGAVNAHQLEITPARRVAFLQAEENVEEAVGRSSIWVAIDEAYDQALQVPYSFEGTALQGSDFTVASSNPLVIPAGAAGAFLDIDWLDDAEDEGLETLTITLGSPQGAALGNPGVATIRVIDNDGTTGPLTSDDFNSDNFDTSLWSFANPLGDAQIRMVGTGTSDAGIEISLPEGVEHVVYDTLTSPRLLQDVPNGDFRVEVKFDSLLSAAYQGQGLIFQQDDSSYLRFDVFYNGAGHRLYAAAILNGNPDEKLNQSIADPTTSLWLRVTRTGDFWTQEYSADGLNWNLGATFNQSLQLTQAGVFALNAVGDSSPAFTSRVDYFEWDSDPIQLEDQGAGDVGGAPFVHAIQPIRGHRTLQIEWATDEPSEGYLEYGLTGAYELGQLETPVLAHEQRVALIDLDPSSTYHFRIVSRDAGGQTTVTQDDTLSTLSPGSIEPFIDVWYGMTPSFGAIGQPQQWINVQGNVSGPEGVAYLTMSLNGGPDQVMGIGPNQRRLENAGDFVVEYDFADLLPGQNEILLRAYHGSNLSITTEEIVLVDYAAGNTWPDTYSLDWANLDRIDQGAQVVDGKWELDGSQLTMVEAGYDRLVAIGDEITWDDYEVECTITMHGIEPVYTFPANPGPSVGFLLRWIGHQPTGNHQPGQGYVPLGTIACYQWYGDGTERLELQDDVSVTADESGKTLEFEVPYRFKARVVTGTEATDGIYSLKVWREGEPEPAGWDVSQTMPNDLETGSLLLLLHYAYASYGEVTVTPL